MKRFFKTHQTSWENPSGHQIPTLLPRTVDAAKGALLWVCFFLVHVLNGRFGVITLLWFKKTLVLQDPSESVFWAGVKGLNTS